MSQTNFHGPKDVQAIEVYFLLFQVDVIESQYGILLDKISNTRDYEAVKLAHDQFLSALLAQSFVHMRSVSRYMNFVYV